MKYNIPEYKPVHPDFDLSKCLSAFLLVKDARTKSGYRSIPIPYDDFAAYLDTLEDDE